MKTQHTYETHGNQTLCFRNGQPIIMAVAHEEEGYNNVVSLHRLRELKGNDVMRAIMEALGGVK